MTKILRNLLLVVLAVLVLKLVSAGLDAEGVVKASTPLPVVVLGTIIGMTYGLLAVGLVLIYRTNRIINFAHGQIGAFAAAFFGLAAVKWGLPYWLAFPLALVLAAGTGAVTEIGVIRRLRTAPRLMSVVATLGVGQFLVFFSALLNNQAAAGALYPQPPGLPEFNVGALRVTRSFTGMLLFSPLLVVALWYFFKRSRFGLGIRAAAANPEAARMVGIYASRTSSLAWALAGILSAYTAILTAPTLGFISTETFGPSLLLRAMVAAVAARMQSLPAAMIGGIGLGILEQILFANYPRSGLVELVLFGLILAMLLTQRSRDGRVAERGSWAAVQALRPLPEKIREIWLVRNLGAIVGVAFVALLALLPLFINASLAVSFTLILGFAMVGLSIGILTGLSGELTLGQFAVAAIGAVVSFKISGRIGNFPLALLYAGLASAAVSVFIGLPALRIRGIMLTVTTLSFAIATSAWLLGQPWMLGEGHDPGRPIVFGKKLISGQSYYYFALVLFVIVLFIARNVRRSGFGRLLVAIRDNEDNARAFSVRASQVKLQGYLVAGFLAGIGGAAYGHTLSNIGINTFLPSYSISVVVMTVLGGVSVIAGPILGAAFMLGLPLLRIGNIGLAATYFGALLVILAKPGGLAQMVEPLRDNVVAWIARRHGMDLERYRRIDVGVADDRAPAFEGAAPRPGRGYLGNGRVRGGARSGTLLEARRLKKTYGGIAAVHDVSFSVRTGETVGLIGPNGAGKTTTFELLGGFSKPDGGRVFFDRRDISYMSPEDRAGRGLIRSFQDAALFPTMTVEDTVMLALERKQPTRFLPSTLGITTGERIRARHAREVIGMMGLDRYRDRQIQELSTGTRRVAELACMVALEPVCLLLDEPSSGIAQRETEALGELLLDLKRQFGLTLVVIEHDIPLIMGISDRILAMAEGRLIASGTPDEIRNDPLVVDAYLGGGEPAQPPSGAPSMSRKQVIA